MTTADFTHEKQQELWEAEHRKPTALIQMDSTEGSGGVVRFFKFLKPHGKVFSGVEMGCGKGRNVIWLAKQPEVLVAKGFDFSSYAIEEARRRAYEAGVEEKVEFKIADATERWPYEDASLDFVIDCFAKTDIESPDGRKRSVEETVRVLKPGGFLLVYALSVDDAFHKEMIKKYPAEERNAFFNPEGKFEKVFDAEELADLHKGLMLMQSERVQKHAVFYGNEYECKHFWNVYRKP